MKINVKYSIKKIVFLFLYYLLFFTRIKKPNSLLVLTYHRITDEPDLQDPLKVSAANFEKQILFLKKNYRIISGEELVDIIKNNKPFPKNSCLITFDDGWMDNYINAFQILKKYNVPAIIFISTDYIGTNRIFWHERLCNILTRVDYNSNKLSDIESKWPTNILERISNIINAPEHQRRLLINDLVEFIKSYSLDEINNLIRGLEALFDVVEEVSQPVMLSWEQVKEMSQNNICFGSHTKSHTILTQISTDKVFEELREPKSIIENKLGKPVYFFAYPNGNYNDFIIRAAIESGHLASFTCISGLNFSLENRFELKRKHIGEDIALGFNNEFSELFLKVELFGIREYLKKIFLILSRKGNLKADYND